MSNAGKGYTNPASPGQMVGFHMEFGKLVFRHICANCGLFVTSQLYKGVEETRVPGENHRLTPSHLQLFHKFYPKGIK